MADIINCILTGIEIIIMIVGIVIPLREERNGKLPKLVLSFTPEGLKPNKKEDEKSEYLLSGYFSINKKFDQDLHDFLIKNNFKFSFLSNNFLEEILDNYDNGTYKKECNDYNSKETSQIIRKFLNNKDFMSIINRYRNYKDQSKRILTIRNVGTTDALDFTINLFDENRGWSIYNNASLTFIPNSKKTIVLYYLDKSAIVDKRNDNIYHNYNEQTIFYLVDEKKYNKKDEKLFFITYQDIYSKIHKI